MGDKYAKTTDLTRVLKKAMNKIDKEVLECLFQIMDYNHKGAVSEEEFISIMKPWASFSATDINEENELDI